jgi:predicted HTH domain antitoxin
VADKNLPTESIGGSGVTASAVDPLQDYDIGQAERIVLAVIRAGDRRGVEQQDHLWVQKVAFLFLRLMEQSKGRGGVEGEGYAPHDYGPYSEEMVGAIDNLLSMKLLSEGPGKTFKPSPAGALLADSILASKDRARRAIESIMDVIAGLGAREIILYVYSTSPEWAKESVVRDVLRDRAARLALAKKLFVGGKISEGRAAQIAGVPLPELHDRLGESHVE